MGIQTTPWLNEKNTINRYQQNMQKEKKTNKQPSAKKWKGGYTKPWANVKEP